MKKIAYFYIRFKNPHIRALNVWSYIKNLERAGLLERAFCNVK